MKHRFLPEIFGVVLLAGVLATTMTGEPETGALGPVDTLTLANSDGDLVLKSSNKRLTWGDKKTSTLWSVGFMEINKALAQLLQADHFIEAREDLVAEREEYLGAMRATLDAIREEGSLIEPNDPGAPLVRQRWEQAYKEYQQMQQESAAIRAALHSAQIKEAYAEIIEAVNVVAERMEIDVVMQFIPPDSEFEPGTPDSTITQIRLRGALRLPEGIEITDDVLTELGLETQ